MIITKKNDLRFMTFVSPLHCMLLICLCLFLLSLCMLGWLVCLIIIGEEETQIARRSVLLNRTERLCLQIFNELNNYVWSTGIFHDSYLKKRKKCSKSKDKATKHYSWLLSMLTDRRSHFPFTGHLKANINRQLSV